MSETILLRGTEEEIEDMKQVAEGETRIKNKTFETEITDGGPEVVVSGMDDKNSKIAKEELSDSGLKEDIIRIE